MIVATPQLLPAVQGRMARLPRWSATEVEGGVSYRSRYSEETLTIGQRGVMLTAESGRFVAVPSNQMAALLKWNDAKLTLIGTDGFSVQLDPSDWDGTGDAIQTLENSTDPDLIVKIDSPGPVGQKPTAPAAPSAEAADGASPVTARRKPSFARRRRYWLLLAAWLVVLTVTLLEKLISLEYFAIMLGVVLGSRGLRRMGAYRRRSKPRPKTASDGRMNPDE